MLYAKPSLYAFLTPCETRDYLARVPSLHSSHSCAFCRQVLETPQQLIEELRQSEAEERGSPEGVSTSLEVTTSHLERPRQINACLLMYQDLCPDCGSRTCCNVSGKLAGATIWRFSSSSCPVCSQPAAAAGAGSCRAFEAYGKRQCAAVPATAAARSRHPQGGACGAANR